MSTLHTMERQVTADASLTHYSRIDLCYSEVKGALRVAVTACRSHRTSSPRSGEQSRTQVDWDICRVRRCPCFPKIRWSTITGSRHRIRPHSITSSNSDILSHNRCPPMHWHTLDMVLFLAGQRVSYDHQVIRGRKRSFVPQAPPNPRNTSKKE